MTTTPSLSDCAYLTALVVSSEDAIVGKSLDGTIRFWNVGATHLYGHAAEDMIGRPASILVPPERAEDFTTFENAVRRGESLYGYETIRRRRDGTTFEASMTISPVVDGDGTLVGLSTITRDVTERRNLERQVLQASEHERAAIGRDLHDGLASLLAGLALRTQALADAARKGAVVSHRDLEIVADLLDTGAESARSLARGLNPVHLERDGLSAALGTLVEGARATRRVECRLSVPETQPSLDPTTAQQLYWIAQEAVTNALRHAGASSISVSLDATDHQLQLVVSDDGRGIDEAKEGLGLHLMRYRAGLIGALLRLEELHPHGTRVRLSLTLAEGSRT